MTWQPGEIVALRGMYNQRPWHIQSVIMVKDTPQEVALMLLPGAECAAPPGYIHGKHGQSGHWDRWREAQSNAWTLERYRWRTNRFLILLEPGAYYAAMYIWEHATHIFQCYYINFQLPFQRSYCGFDTFDLELDLVLEGDYTWRWKDVEGYARGIHAGLILPEWHQGVEQARGEVLEKIEKRIYPFNGSWLGWLPEAAWHPPQLPLDWEKV